LFELNIINFKLLNIIEILEIYLKILNFNDIAS